MRNLRSVLVNEFGLDLTGWTLTHARDISADGLIFVGEGVRSQTPFVPEAWIVTLPSYPDPPDPCAADTDADGAVQVFDLLAVLASWGPCPAPCDSDINNDGAVNVTDLLALLAAWGACP
ncbi:MAG: hypothetical protein IH891_10885 [Planctomycetes bacterium]|nr:hypothetical protein [Planctomycetota bacterium]